MAKRGRKTKKVKTSLKTHSSSESIKTSTPTTAPATINPAPVVSPTTAPPTSPPVLDILYFIPNDNPISGRHLRAIETQMPRSQQTNTLHLVLHSIGGDPFTAVKIMRRLKQTYKTIRAIIPDKAYSAATLMSLGTQELYMSVNACIGPLDLPIEHPAEGSRISALDVVNAATTISSFVEEIALRRFLDLRDSEKFNIKNRLESAKIAYKYATDLVLPIMSKMDPYQTQKSYRELKIAWWYAYDLLCNGLMKNNAKNAWKTSKQLVTLFPSHDYDIFREDAKYLLDLPVHDLETLAEWSRIEPDYKTALTSGTHIIFRQL